MCRRCACGAVRLVTAHQARKALPLGVDILGMADAIEALANPVLGRVTQDANERRIHALDPAVAIDHRGAQRRVFPRRAKLRLAHLQRDMIPVPLGDEVIRRRGDGDEDGDRDRVERAGRFRRREEECADRADGDREVARPAVAEPRREVNGEEED
jgi:hypothetical protein